MAQILIRHLDEQLIERLKKQAEREGRSVQSEVKRILEQAVLMDPDETKKMAERVRRRFKASKFDDRAAKIREDRQR